MTATVVKLPPLTEYASRGFNLPDLNEKGQWIVDRLKPRYPHASEGEVVNWLRSITTSGSNDFMFVRTEHAFALAQVTREVMSARPIVIEHFVLVEGENVDEGGYLYGVIAQWARGLGAYELRVEKISDADVPVDSIKARIGRLFQRDQTFHKLD